MVAPFCSWARVSHWERGGSTFPSRGQLPGPGYAHMVGASHWGQRGRFHARVWVPFASHAGLASCEIIRLPAECCPLPFSDPWGEGYGASVLVPSQGWPPLLLAWIGPTALPPSPTHQIPTHFPCFLPDYLWLLGDACGREQVEKDQTARVCSTWLVRQFNSPLPAPWGSHK